MTLLSRIVAPGPRILIRTSGVAKVALKISQNPNLTTGVTTTAAANPNSLGVTQFAPTGLVPGAYYYYRVVMDNATDKETVVGRFRTPPVGRSSFTFAFGSCSKTDSNAYSAIYDEDDDLFFHLGDLWYADGESTSLANYRAHLQSAFTATNLRNVLATTNFCYTPSDHDSGMANDQQNLANVATFRQAYYENVPTQAQRTDGIYWSFVWGRVRFVVLDTRSYKSNTSVPDGPDKTMLGAVQKQWLKDLYATATEPLFVLMSDMTMSGTASATNQSWRGYTYERQEIIDASQGRPTILLSGDIHVLAYQTNLGNGWVEWVSSPIDQTPDTQAGSSTWEATYPTAADGLRHHFYARVSVTDDGQDIIATYTGYEAPNTPRLSTTFRVFAPENPGQPIIPTQPAGTTSRVLALPDPIAPPTLFDLRVVDPATGQFLDYLDGWSDLAITTDRQAPGQMTFTIPANSASRALMRTTQQVVFLQDGREGDNCRFILRNCDTNLAGDVVPTEDYQFESLIGALKDAQFLPADGATKTRTWTNQTVGQQLVDVMSAASARGSLAWWGYKGLTFDATNDSAGKPWPKIERMEHEYGISVFDVWDWLISQNYIDVTMTGGRINAYNREGGGTDRTVGNNPLILSEGIHLVDAPQQETWDDFVNYLTVIGGETPDPTDDTKTLPRIYVTLSSGINTWGRREKSLHIDGVQSATELGKIGQQYLKTFTGPRTSRTYRVDVTNRERQYNILGVPDDLPIPNPIPMLDFRVGDTIGVSLADGQPMYKERVEVISATLQGRYSGQFLITVNDWLDHRQLIRDRIYRLTDKETT